MTASYPPLRDLPPEEPPLVRVTPLPNPLRDARDRRLPRVPGPCALVVFGVTGDLARKKLIPAVYDLANRGLLPPGFAMVGFARRDWGDGDFAELARKAAQDGSRTGFRDDVWARLSDSIRFVPGSFDDDQAFDTLAETLISMEETHGIQGNAAFYLSIPPAMFPVVLKQMQRTRMADNSQRGGWRRVVVEKPFGHDLQSGKDLNRLVDEVFTATGRLPDRPLPRQGDRPEPAGAAVRQHDVRAGVERQLRRLGADHDGRGRRHRQPGRLLRHGGCRARRAAEPRAAAAGADRDGGAGRLRRRGDQDREDQGAGRDRAARRPRALRGARPVRPGLAGRRSGSSPTSTRRTSRRPRPPRPTPPSGSTSRPAAGPACRSTCAPASGCRAG